MIRVLLAEDMTMVLGALAALLSYEDDIQVVAELDRGDLIVPTALDADPDVAVIDVGLPGVDGLTAARELHKELPRCSTVLLTGMGTPRMLQEAFDAGAQGFVVKNAPPHQLAETIRRVANGEYVIDAKLAMSALTDATNNPLNVRELEIVRLAAEGASVIEIARRLSLATGTVRNYFSGILAKLHARNRLDAVRIARDEGWI